MSETAGPMHSATSGMTGGLYRRVLLRMLRPLLAEQRREAKLQADRVSAEVRELTEMLRHTAQKIELLREWAEPLKDDVRVLFDLQYRQIESAIALYSTLDLQVPLPTMRNWAVSPDFACELVRIIERMRPSTVVELGSGSSTIVVAAALARNGHGRLLSLDHDDEWMRRTVWQLETNGLAAVADVVHAPLTPIILQGDEYPWYDLSVVGGLPSIDMLIVDGPPGPVRKQSRYPAVPLLHASLAAGALVVADDTKRPDETAIITRWREEFGLEQLEGPVTEKGMEILRFGGEASD